VIPFPGGARVWLATGRTDMMRWTPPAANLTAARRTCRALERRRADVPVTTIGIDLAKSVFLVHGVDEAGATVLRRKCSRTGLLKLLAELPPSVVGMEAGAGAHHWAREIGRLGHEVRLMPPRYVRPYVKTNKHDAADAEACCEAVGRPGMRFVPVKDVGQQAAMVLHRVRDHLVRQRTGSINALRGHAAEFGLVAPAQRRGLNEIMALVDDGHPDLPEAAREVLALLVAAIRAADERIAELDRRLVAAARADERCRRLAAVPGVGPVVATAVAATLVCPGQFTSGRHFAAWLGLTPRQHSSGGKERLLGISKRGDAYLRRQLISGARAVVRVAEGKRGELWDWANALRARRPFNVVVAAVANKLARVLWALCARGTECRWATAA
jgi:transposase